jgi:hypothetical protein
VRCRSRELGDSVESSGGTGDDPKVRSERLFKIVRGDVKSPSEVFALTDGLEGRAELFSALSDPDHGYWIERPACRPYDKSGRACDPDTDPGSIEHIRTPALLDERQRRMASRAVHLWRAGFA